MLDRSDSLSAVLETSVLLPGSIASPPDRPPSGVPCIPKPSPLARLRIGTQFPIHTYSSLELSWHPPCRWTMALVVSDTDGEIVSWMLLALPCTSSRDRINSQGRFSFPKEKQFKEGF